MYDYHRPPYYHYPYHRPYWDHYYRYRYFPDWYWYGLGDDDDYYFRHEFRNREG